MMYDVKMGKKVRKSGKNINDKIFISFLLEKFLFKNKYFLYQ